MLVAPGITVFLIFVFIIPTGVLKSFIVIIIISNWIINKGYLEGFKQISNVRAIVWKLDLLGVCIGKPTVTVKVTWPLVIIKLQTGCFRKTLALPSCYQAYEELKIQI